MDIVLPQQRNQFTGIASLLWALGGGRLLNLLSGGAVARVGKSNLKELVITDSIQPTQAVNESKNIRVLSIATLIGEAINRTAAEESVSSLFD